MARKVEQVVIEAEGRDKGKTFVLTEMPAVQAERWATTALNLLTGAGAPIPAGAAESGMAGLAAAPIYGLPALRALQDPSLDAWWGCVQYQHAPNVPLQKIFDGATCQIEEIATINHLRTKVLELHIAPFFDVSPSTTGSPSPGPTTHSSHTRTSHES